MKKEELLKVLDMSEDEQDSWVRVNTRPYLVRESLADLAFQLRDEVSCRESSSVSWRQAKYAVCFNETKYTSIYNKWFVDEAKPIHWIIAALIAKEDAA